VSRSPSSEASFLADVSAKIGTLVAVCCPAVEAPGLVVGLSGGPDSVALLLAAHAWARRTGSSLAAAHFNHGLRPGEAEQDAAFCRDLCRTLDVRLFEGGEDPRPLARTRGQGIEDAARHLRRRFFRGILAENEELHCIATGHHRDDQVETVLMRLFRGTGPEGLRGILPVSGAFIHPLLSIKRTRIIGFLEDCGQAWRTDPSNLDGDNTRARIRRELLPLVRGIFGRGCDAGPVRLAELLQQDLALLDDLTRDALGSVTIDGPDGHLSVPRLLELEHGLAARVLRAWLGREQPSGLERVHVDAVLAWLAGGQSGTSLDLPGSLRLTREFDALKMDTGQPAPPLRNAGDYRILVSRNSGEPATPPRAGAEGVGDPADEATWRLTCPAAVLAGNLKVRNPRPGDRFQPFGLDGSKKLSDLLREHRVPSGDRPGVLVVTDDAGILWVVGVARAERTRLLPFPEQTVTISVAKRSDHPKQGNDT
jgi:tRNA(Ile)-lysidine synthase